jgi:hypothetical protein
MEPGFATSDTLVTEGPATILFTDFRFRLGDAAARRVMVESLDNA